MMDADTVIFLWAIPIWIVIRIIALFYWYAGYWKASLAIQSLGTDALIISVILIMLYLSKQNGEKK